MKTHQNMNKSISIHRLNAYQKARGQYFKIADRHPFVKDQYEARYRDINYRFSFPITQEIVNEMVVLAQEAAGFMAVGLASDAKYADGSKSITAEV